MDKRRQSRTKRRFNCEIVAGQERHVGIALDLSSGGLFVQTKATLQPNSVLEVRFPAANGIAAFSLRARVSRARKVPPHLLRVVVGGLGLEVLEAPPQYEQLVSGRRDAAASSVRGAPRAGPAAEQGPSHFRVRVKQVGGVRSRTLTLQSPSERGAKEAALGQVGEGWEVVQVERA